MHYCWPHVTTQLAKELGRKYQKCLYCYKHFDNKKESLYHRKCSLELFNTESAPVLDFEISELKELAKQNLNEKLAVPGVQRKVSLSVEKSVGVKGQKAYRLTVANLWARYILKPELAFISEKFDRPRTGGKLHAEDFCQILEKRPEQKYILHFHWVAKKTNL